MNTKSGNPQEKYNYGYIKYDFDVANAAMDEATVYYIKLMTPGTPGFLAAELYTSNIDNIPIDYDNVDEGQQFNDETFFSTALKNDYLNQAIGILKHIEPSLKARREDPNNLNHRYCLYKILKLEDEEVIQKIDELAPYSHKGFFEDQLTAHDFAPAREKAELIRRIQALMPLDFPAQVQNGHAGSWFGEFIKNKQFSLAEKYLEPYVGNYVKGDILIKDLSLQEPEVSAALKEMSTKNPKSIFGRIHESLKRILPTDVYFTYILHKQRYDLNEDLQQGISSRNKNPREGNNTASFTFPQTRTPTQGILMPLDLHPTASQAATKTTHENNPDMALFLWGQRHRGSK